MAGDVLPMLRVEGRVIFPHENALLSAKTPSDVAVIEHAGRRPDRSLVALSYIGAFDHLYHVGVRLVLDHPMNDCSAVVAQAIGRVRLMADHGANCGRFVAIPDPADGGGQLVEALRQMLASLRCLALLGSPLAQEACSKFATGEGDLLAVVYQLARVLCLPVPQSQAVLEAPRRIDAVRLMGHYVDQMLAGSPFSARNILTRKMVATDNASVISPRSTIS